MSVLFILLAHGAAFNIFLHKLHKAQPSELSNDELTGLEIARVAGSLVVMIVDKDKSTEGVLWENVDVPFVGENMVVIFPVREMRLKSSGDVLQRQL